MGRLFFAGCRVAAVFVGAVIGAGFASGREIVTFFDPLGPNAPLGLAGTVLVLAGGGWLAARAAADQRLANYGEVFRATAGRLPGLALDLLVTVFLYLTAGVTLAGGAALLRVHYHLSPAAGLAVTAAAAGLLAAGGVKAMFRLGPWLVPLLLLALAVILAGSPPALPPPAAAGATPTAAAGLAAVAAGALYGGLNLILAAGVLVAGARQHGPAATALGALSGTAALGLLAGLILRACRAAGPEVIAAPLPVAALAARLGPAGLHCYAVLLYLAVQTTLVAVANCLAARCRPALRPAGRGPDRLAALVVLAALLPAGLDFAYLVRLVYPPLGFLGVLWVALLLIRA